MDQSFSSKAYRHAYRVASACHKTRLTEKSEKSTTTSVLSWFAVFVAAAVNANREKTDELTQSQPFLEKS